MPPRPTLPLVALALLTALSFLLAVGNGSVTLGWTQWWDALNGSSGLAHDVVWQLRLPRALAALAVGALLAMAGALMQVLLRNPLADPYVLGISGGAAVGALGAGMLGAAAAGASLGALAGALGSTLLVFGLAHGAGGWTTSRLLLTGVVVATGWGAVITLLLALAPDQQLRGMLFWLIGDLGAGEAPWRALIVLGVGLTVGMPLARELNVLGRGEVTAMALGVDTRVLRPVVYLLASLLTAAAVTTAGSVGFVGLVVPHLVRLAAGNDLRILLPGSALGGASLVLLADTVARSLLAPMQLPVGAITAIIGVPLFLYLLRREARSGGVA
jgi:iron complex transport system permease protein